MYQAITLKQNIMKTYTYRVTDNNFYNAFETTSHYDAMAEVTERLEGSKMVVTLLDKTTGIKKAYRWDANNNVVANY